MTTVNLQDWANETESRIRELEAKIAEISEDLDRQAEAAQLLVAVIERLHKRIGVPLP